MKKTIQTDVFISYRRSDGAANAHILYSDLTKRGYRCFHDVDTLRSGEFNIKIFEAIDNAKDVIIVLSPDTFADINERESWMQKEIRYALEKEKNIIPVMTEGFTFPEELPEDIAKLKYMHGLSPSMELFDGFMEKLCQFLESKPVKRKPNLKIALAATLTALAVTVVAFLVNSGIFTQLDTYPNSQNQKNTVSEIFSYTSGNLQLYDNVEYHYGEALDAWETYLNHPTADTLKNANDTTNRAIEVISTTDWASQTLSNNDLNNFSNSPFDYAAVKDFNSSLQLISNINIDNLRMLSTTMTLDFNNIDERIKILNLYKEYSELEHKSVINSLNHILLPISSDYPDFIVYKRDVLSLLTHIKELSSYVWLDNSDALEAAAEVIFNQQQRVLYDINSIVGEANSELNESEYIVSSVSSIVEAISSKKDVISSKQEAVSSMNDNLASVADMLAEAKARLWEKFKPTEEDNAFTLLFKSVKFKTVNMYDEAFLCLDNFLKKVNENTTPEITPESGERIYNAAKAVFEQKKAGIAIDGLLIWGFEDGSTENEFLKIGDIVTHINGKECHLETDWNDNCKLEEADTFIYLRLSDDGTFETLTYVREKTNGVGIGCFELTEHYE
jgi:hypothetical protein